MDPQQKITNNSEIKPQITSVPQQQAASPNPVSFPQQVPAQPGQPSDAVTAAQPIVNSDSQKNPFQNKRKVPFAIIVIVLFVLVVAGVLIWLTTSKKDESTAKNDQSVHNVLPGKNPAPPSISNGKTGVNNSTIEAMNVNRKNDAAEISAGVAEFYANNNGALPQITTVKSNNLYICGIRCNGTTDVKVLNLAYYNPANVSIHSYTGALKVPDTEMVYIVTGAKCASQTSIGTAGRNADSVILFALQGPSVDQQQCIEQ